MTKRRTTIVTGDVKSVDHVGTSHSGNPTYRVTLTDGRAWNTARDHSVGYSASNYRPHSLNRPVVSVVLTIGGRGTIVDMTRADGLRD